MKIKLIFTLLYFACNYKMPSQDNTVKIKGLELESVEAIQFQKVDDDKLRLIFAEAEMLLYVENVPKSEKETSNLEGSRKPHCEVTISGECLLSKNYRNQMKMSSAFLNVKITQKDGQLTILSGDVKDVPPKAIDMLMEYFLTME